jgi:hypothetical protein
VCAAQIKYVGHDELVTDLANLKRSLAGKKHDEAFVTAISPSNLELYYENRHYNSDEEIWRHWARQCASSTSPSWRPVSCCRSTIPHGDAL